MTNGGIVAHSIDHSRTADVTERSRARAAAARIWMAGKARATPRRSDPATGREMETGTAMASGGPS